MRLPRIPLLFLFLAGLLPRASADVLVVEPDRDNTLYETTDGSLSNGAGEHLFAGVTETGFARRTVLRFDLSAIPQGKYVKKVNLIAHVSKVPLLAPSTVFDLHRVTADWGEGSSDAPGEEGGGGPSAPGDATWLHRFYPNDDWSTPGGDHAAQVSAQTVAPGVTGPVSWSSPGLVADVQRWVDDPGSNFGWLIRAEEELSTGTAKRFDSREFGGPATRPRLTVVFEDVPPSKTPEKKCAPVVFCATNPANVADVGVSGCACAAGSLLVTLSGAAPGEFGYLLVGKGTTPLTDPPGASGDLCLGGAPIGRFAADVAQIDGAGGLVTDVLNAASGGGGGNVPNLGGNFCAPPGQTWSFQYWYRDQGTSRFSRALRVILD